MNCQSSTQKQNLETPPNSEALTMDARQIMINKQRKEEETEDINNDNCSNIEATECLAANREGRRKLAKKEKRKKKRKELAEMVRQEEEARLNDPEELLRLQTEEEMEKARMERERREFEEREKNIMEEWERRRALEEEEEERRRRAMKEEDHLKGNQVENENDADEDEWEYVEEGPPEIIWQGNEIIVKKKKVRVKKKDGDQNFMKEDPNRPTSNPLPPQSEAFVSYKNGSNPSAQQLLENVANQTPNFGTEQDKAHCPFHLKTGACRFGSHCSRIHFYPDKSHTLLIKSMYNGPGLAWEQDDGLEVYIILAVKYTDEEVERAYEEFYEDVHTEFLKFGEIVNFKVCRNGSSHLRGNVYVHYKSVDSAVLAYESVNGRYFAGKQVQCEFVSVTRWKVAICGEFMKSELKACSRGTACNFIHCFRNPSGDYEWANWDKPPPRYWEQNMAALFGSSDEFAYDKHIERGSPRPVRNSSRTSTNEADRYHSRRAQSRDIYYSRGSRNHTADDIPISAHQRHYRLADRKHQEVIDKKHRDNRSLSKSEQHRNNASTDSDSDRNSIERKRARNSSRKRSRSRGNGRLESQGGKSNVNGADPDTNMFNTNKEKYTQTRHLEKSSGTSRNGKRYKKVCKSPDDDCDDGAEDGSCIFEEKISISDDDSDQASGDRSCRSYGSISRSRKDAGKSEHKGSRKKYEEKSKRKRDTEERGRWEPE